LGSAFAFPITPGLQSPVSYWEPKTYGAFFALPLSILWFSLHTPTLQHSRTPAGRKITIRIGDWSRERGEGLLPAPGSRLPASRAASLSRVGHGLSRVVSRVDAQKRPVFIGLSRCHGSGPPWRPYCARPRPRRRPRSKVPTQSDGKPSPVRNYAMRDRNAE
jgi:hypothetical protein